MKIKNTTAAILAAAAMTAATTTLPVCASTKVWTFVPSSFTQDGTVFAAHVQAGGAGLSAVGLFGRSSCGAHANLRLRVFRDLRDGCGGGFGHGFGFHGGRACW